ncbi:MAG: hypothetical protein KME60_10230 [Cyanomargarita calcarea GSE-NOS-MK-12-04C]|jgi:hypothetical protein|uniref:Uncharacterized protein n=1 Tax=Cyanomargarita calcarea GSE-NOS-MK-12-04C TaxID=2839659 RepID=A0A951QKW9_9CYAN|nr:hypothetical protein [Cyanomargarita calcarea GSE-NOS-MK-12-04C]
MKSLDKTKKIVSPWWRWPLEVLYPDKKFDGQLQNPGSEEVFDFDSVMASVNPIAAIATDIAYYPLNDSRELFAIFVSGLGQREKESSRRSRRYAVTLETGIANMNNASFLKQNPIIGFINRYLDWINATLDYLGLSGSPIIENAASLITYAVNNSITLNLSGDSLGTILLARAIRRAKRKFIYAHTSIFDLTAQRIEEQKWEQRTSNLINVFAFGNGYKKWVKGPNYIMVYIQGDPLAEKFGITPRIAIKQKRDDIKFLIFPRLFPKGSFEAHNMMFTTELLRQTFKKNQIGVGDFARLHKKLNSNTLEIATPEEVSWPSDMKDYTWNPDSLKSIPFE